jgi:hypothetical protein
MATAIATTVPGPPVVTVDLTLTSAEASTLLQIMNFINGSNAPAAAKALASSISTALTGAGVS